MKNIKQIYTHYAVNNVCKEDSHYPKQLLELKSPPKKIYYRGMLEKKLFINSIAIVGSRRMTRYGASVVDRFVSAFVQNGITTISGYMYGVDTEVHCKTVEYGGKTVAVMGNGINKPYPPDNDKLYTKILQSSGVVLSEYEPEAKPKLWMYPARNRVIAALATVGVLVVEAGENSGSLITAKYAEKLNKKIFAVPGPVTSSVSGGTNLLIKSGKAALVTDPYDIIKNSTSKKADLSPNTFELSEAEQIVFSVLRGEDMSVDEIVVATQLDMVQASTALSLLSLKNIVADAGGRYYIV